MKIIFVFVVCLVSACFCPAQSLAHGKSKSQINVQEVFPLLDEKPSPETKTAKEFLDLICTSNMFKNCGTIGEGRGELDKSLDCLSKSYLSKITPKQYLGHL